MKKRLNMLLEFSVPLLGGVAFTILWANSAPESYFRLLHGHFVGPFSLHFLTNDIFMVFFFGIAAVEITHSLMPGGDLYPIEKSISPLFATSGGVIGRALVYLALNHFFGSPEMRQGWGIPTATDIAFAWLVARLIFGKDHPSVSFLLLLAVVDDAVGLVIIALFYPDPLLPVAPQWLLLTLAGTAIAYLLRKQRVLSYWPFLFWEGVCHGWVYTRPIYTRHLLWLLSFPFCRMQVSGTNTFSKMIRLVNRLYHNSSTNGKSSLISAYSYLGCQCGG